MPHDAEPRAHSSPESCCGLVCAGLEREHHLRRVGKDELVAQALAWESLAETLWMRLLAETQALLAQMSLANVMDARLFLSQEELEPALVQHAVRGERGRGRARGGVGWGAERERETGRSYIACCRWHLPGQVCAASSAVPACHVCFSNVVLFRLVGQRQGATLTP